MTTGYEWAKKSKTQMLLTEMLAKGLRPKRNKYGAKKVKLDGYTFDSQREAQVYGELKLLEKAGQISHLEVHPKYEIKINGILVCGFKPDFRFYDKRNVAGTRVVDVKSPPTAARRDFIIARKLMRAVHGVDVEVIC